MTAQPADVHGTVAPGFEPVRDVFTERVAEIGDGGAAFAAVADGELVIDLWAGQAGGVPWRRETRGVLMSATKGIAALVVARLVERGLLDVEAPVADWWPEFAGGGKASVTVAHVLSHSAGLITVPGYQEFLDPSGDGWDNTGEILRRLQAAEPEWPAGTAHAYHGLTIGWIIGELVRRVAGASVGAILHDEIAAPLGLDLDLGTPFDRQHLVAPVIVPGDRPPALAVFDEQLADPTSLLSRLFLTVAGRSVLTCADTFFANPDLLAMELPAANATGTARSLATLYGGLARGGGCRDVRLLSPATIDAFTAERIGGPGLSTGLEKRWALGFALQVPPLPGMQREWGPRREAFGHNGYGGQIGFADPVGRLGVGFLRNHLSWDSPLGGLLVDAVYECLPQPQGPAQR